MAFWIFLGIIVLIVGYFILIYNNLVSLQQSIRGAWADIEVQLKRRFNLIPALIDTVKGYKNYEQETLEKVIEARNSFNSSSSIEEKAKAGNMLTKALGGIFALAEAYPELKANENFINLQNELANTEDIIQNARRYYNATVRDYNTKIHSFPDMIIAKKFNFVEFPYFELDENEKKDAYKMPKVDL